MRIGAWSRRGIARIEAATSGYLVQVGWIGTRADRRARDTEGNPIPWFTYPAIALLAERVRPEWRVLEFGAGMGTLWWSKRVREVTAVEHDVTWANEVSNQCGARVVRVLEPGPAAYLQQAIDIGLHDVVVVDGQFRHECLITAPTLLGAGGVIVLDDAQRAEYQPAVAELRAADFRVLKLHGPQPVSKHPGCTAILYREHNVLGL